MFLHCPKCPACSGGGVVPGAVETLRPPEEEEAEGGGPGERSGGEGA